MNLTEDIQITRRSETLDLNAKHTCWDDPEWDGLMQDGCPGCEHNGPRLLASSHRTNWKMR